MVLEALNQSSRNGLDSNSSSDLQEKAVDSCRPSKRVKRVHSRPPLGNKDKGKEIDLEDSEKDGSQFSTDINAAAVFDDPDNGLDASLPAPDDNDEAAQEYTKTEKYRRSMYVDAFNLALDTVLQDELHLFSDVEQEIFAKYRSLEYEPQFLYAIHSHLTLLKMLC